MNITGNGLKDQIRYQGRLISDPRDRGGIDLSQPMYFQTYGEWTKKEGLAKIDPMKGGATQLTSEDAKVSYRKARDFPPNSTSSNKPAPHDRPCRGHCASCRRSA